MKYMMQREFRGSIPNVLGKKMNDGLDCVREAEAIEEYGLTLSIEPPNNSYFDYEDGDNE